MRVFKISRFRGVGSKLIKMLIVGLLIQTVVAEEPIGVFQKPTEHSANDLNLSLENNNVPEINDLSQSFKSSEHISKFGEKINFWNFKPVDGPNQDQIIPNAELGQNMEHSSDNMEAGQNSMPIEPEPTTMAETNPENQTPASDRTFKLFKVLGKVLEHRPIIPIFTSKTKIYPPASSYHDEGPPKGWGWGRPPRRPRRKPKWGRRPRRYRKRRPGKSNIKPHFPSHFPKFPQGPPRHHKKRRPRKKPRHKRRHRHRRPRPHYHDDHDDHFKFNHGPEHNDFDHGFEDSKHFDRPPSASHAPTGFKDDVEYDDHGQDEKALKGFRTPFWTRPKPHAEHTEAPIDDHSSNGNFDNSPINDGPEPSDQGFGPERGQDSFPNSFDDGHTHSHSSRPSFGPPKPSFSPPQHETSGFHGEHQGEEHFPNDFNDNQSFGPQGRPFGKPKPDDYDGPHSDDFDGPNHSPQTFGPPRRPFRRPRPDFGPQEYDNHGFDYGPDHHPNSINDQLPGPPRRRPFRQRRPFFGPPQHQYDQPSPQGTESHHEIPQNDIQSYPRPYQNSDQGPQNYGPNEFSTPYREEVHPPPRRPYYRRPRPIHPPPHHPSYHNDFQDYPANHPGNGPPHRPPPHSFRQMRPYPRLPPPAPPPQHSYQSHSPADLHGPPPPAPLFVPPRNRPRPAFAPTKEPEVIYGSSMKPKYPPGLQSAMYGPSPQSHKLRLPIPFKPVPTKQSQDFGNNPHHNNFIDQSSKPVGSGTQDEPQRPGMSQQLFNQVKNLVMKLTSSRNNTNQNPPPPQNQHHHHQPPQHGFRPVAFGNNFQSHNLNTKIPLRDSFGYSTLPKSMAQFKPDPTHQTLPKLTYDSIRSESSLMHHDPTPAQQHQGKAVVPSSNNIPATRTVTKFTASDAIIIPKLQRRMTSAEGSEKDEGNESQSTTTNNKSDEKGLELKLKPQRGFQNMIKAHAKLM